MVSGSNDLRGFHHVFSTRTRKNLLESHLWFSLYTKPPRARFTRVERLTCILVILFATMLANLISFYFKQTAAIDPGDNTILFSVIIALLKLPQC